MMYKSLTLLSAMVIALPAIATEPTFTVGPATVVNEGLIDCGSRSRVSPVGVIEAADGSQWTVPADTHFLSAPKASDLYNECGGDKLRSLDQLDLNSVPLMDAGGSEEFVAYIFGDNYFELFVNGKLLAVDPVPFTPFNSNVVRFQADRPLTLAVMAVDWEENVGLGSERNRGSAFHPGDGGFVAHIQDANGETIALTDNSWKAQTFYTAPLKDQSCLVIKGNIRDSSRCDDSGVDDASDLSAAHWAVPENWMAVDYDASTWPNATTFTNDTVGVDNKKSYTSFTNVFDTRGADAQFIWSTNLVLDNLVLLRKTIE